MEERESKLINRLKEAGRPELAKILYEEMEYDDFVNKYADKLTVIPGVAELLLPKTIDAPHGMSEEEADLYFDDQSDKEAYSKSEEEYGRTLDEKRKVADEYQRSKDDSYFNKPLLANEYATKRYREGDTRGALGEDLWAKAAFASDFMPFPLSVIGPTARTAQMWRNDDLSLSKIPGILFDFGTSVLGPAKGAAKTAYEGVKHYAGPVAGKLFDTKLAKGVEKGIEQIDREASEYALKQMDNLLLDLGGSTLAYAANHAPREVIEKANEIKEFAPELAEELITFAKDRNVLKDEISKIYDLQQKFPEQSFGTAGEGAMLARIHPEEFVDDLLKESPEVIAKAEELLGRDVLSEGIRKPATNGQVFAAKAIGASSKPTIKATMSDVYSNEPDNKSVETAYNNALDQIIKENEKLWSLPGKRFKPREIEGDMLYEAWKKWNRGR